MMRSANHLRQLLTLFTFHKIGPSLNVIDLDMVDLPRLAPASRTALGLLDSFLQVGTDDRSITDEQRRNVAAGFCSDLEFSEEHTAYFLRYVDTELDNEDLRWTSLVSWTQVLWILPYGTIKSGPESWDSTLFDTACLAISKHMPRDRWGRQLEAFDEALTASERRMVEDGEVAFGRLVRRRGFERTWKACLSALSGVHIEELRVWATRNAVALDLHLSYFGGDLPLPEEYLSFL
jgi:hypothetical protein